MEKTLILMTWQRGIDLSGNFFKYVEVYIFNCRVTEILIADIQSHHELT